MGQGISKVTKDELIQAISKRYQDATRSEKGRILDEFIKLTHYHRKHAIRVLNRERLVEERERFELVVGFTVKQYVRHFLQSGRLRIASVGKDFEQLCQITFNPWSDMDT